MILLNIFILSLLLILIVTEECGSAKPNGEGKDDIQCNPANYYVQDDDCFKILELISIDRGLIFKADNNGWAPLHEASRIGNPVIISLLVENGADALAKTKDGYSPREILLSSRPEILAEDDDTTVKTFKLSEMILINAEKGMGLFGFVIDKEEINRSKYPVTDFPGLAHTLVQYDLIGTLEELIFINEEVMLASDNNGFSLLHEAVRNGNLQMVNFLLEVGAEINDLTNNGETALDIARNLVMNINTQADIIKLLMDSGEKEDQQNRHYLR